MNTGTNEAWMTDPADVHSRDLDGQPRIRNWTVDMGAFEFAVPMGSMITIQ